MKKFMAALGFVLAAGVGTVMAQTTEHQTAIISSYLEIHAALAGDKVEGVKPAAQAIAKHAAELGASGEAIGKAAKAIEGAADIKAARAAFGTLSDAMMAAHKSAEWKDVKVAYCPMVNKSWLQKGDKIQNPYYGSSMLTCGEFKK